MQTGPLLLFCTSSFVHGSPFLHIVVMAANYERRLLARYPSVTSQPDASQIIRKPVLNFLETFDLTFSLTELPIPIHR